MHKVQKAYRGEFGHWRTTGFTANCRPGLMYAAEGLRGRSGVWCGLTRGSRIPAQMAAGVVHQLAGVGGVTSGVQGSDNGGQRGK
jgi:hypothetical protein